MYPIPCYNTKCLISAKFFWGNNDFEYNALLSLKFEKKILFPFLFQNEQKIAS